MGVFPHKCSKSVNKNYNARYPTDLVFNAVEDFVDFADLAKQPVTQRQTVAKAYTILNKIGCFKTAIIKWNCKQDIQQTWIAFKDHFPQAHKEFRETTDTTLEDSELQRNNANLVQQVVEGLQHVLTPEEPPEAESSALIQEMANLATCTTKTQQQLVTQLTQMQQAMALLQTQVNSQSQPYSPPFQHRGGRGYYGNVAQSGRGNSGCGYCSGNGGCGNYFHQRNTAIYCWTHGGCGHLGAICNAKLPGHQDTASFLNKMRGSTYNCPSA
jgi:hypothetical protein